MNDQAYSRTVKKTLLDCIIADLDSVKCLFLKHPEADFIPIPHHPHRS